MLLCFSKLMVHQHHFCPPFLHTFCLLVGRTSGLLSQSMMRPSSLLNGLQLCRVTLAYRFQKMPATINSLSLLSVIELITGHHMFNKLDQQLKTKHIFGPELLVLPSQVSGHSSTSQRPHMSQHARFSPLPRVWLAPLMDSHQGCFWLHDLPSSFHQSMSCHLPFHNRSQLHENTLCFYFNLFQVCHGYAKTNIQLYDIIELGRLSLVALINTIYGI